MSCHVPLNRVHSRTYTVLPSMGSPFTVPDRLSPCDCEYTLVLPAPVVPTSNQYCVAPAAAVQKKVTVVPAKVDPGVGPIINAAETGDASSTSTQSSSPSALFPGVAKTRKPELASGEPGIVAKLPEAGSYHRPVTGPLSRLMSTVSVRAVGTYAIANVPSGVRAAVT